MATRAPKTIPIAVPIKVTVPASIPNTNINNAKKIAQVLSAAFRARITPAHIEALVHFAQFGPANVERYKLLCEFVDDATSAKVAELINNNQIVAMCPHPTPSGIEHERSIGHMTRRDEFNARNAVVNGQNNNKGMRIRTAYRVAMMFLCILRHELPHIAGAAAVPAPVPVDTPTTATPTTTTTKTRARLPVSRVSAAAAAATPASDDADDDDSFQGSDDDDDGLDKNPFTDAIATILSEMADPRVTRPERQIMQESIVRLSVAANAIAAPRADQAAGAYGRFTSAIKKLEASRASASTAERAAIDDALTSLKALATQMQA